MTSESPPPMHGAYEGTAFSMEGSCEYIEKAAMDSWQGMFFQIGSRTRR